MGGSRPVAGSPQTLSQPSICPIWFCCVSTMSVAMERSTEGVVEGTRLSDAAGQALLEIETVSNDLARLIEAISSATVAQTEVAATVSRNMEQIQNITSQTTEGTKQTAQSVGQLSTLAEELSGSVAGFKLS